MTTDPSVHASIAELALRHDPGSRRALRELLLRSERWSTEVLLGHQLRRATQVVEHAREHVPYYASLPVPPTGRAFDGDEWRELPRLTRADLLRHAAELTSLAAPSEHRVLRTASSSGSTGRHVSVLIDAPTHAVNDALALRDHAAHGREPSWKAAAIRAVDPTPSTGRPARWLNDVDSGPLALLDVRTPVRKQIEWLEQERPNYLATYATNAAALVAELERREAHLPDLRALGTFGEVLPDGLRDDCRRVLGVRLVDAYSSAELGYIALECPEAGSLHVQTEQVLVEVLRDDGRPAAPGELGQVVVTALHAFAMPLIRYELGDFAIAGAACRCGRGAPVLQQILGRRRNLLRLPDGDVLWPRYGSNWLGRTPPIEQFRLVQRELDAVVLEVVAGRPLTSEEERQVRALVLGTLGHGLKLSLSYVDALPRSAGGKFEDFVCELPEAPFSARTGC